MSFKITKDKVEKKRIFELIRIGLYTFCFIGLIVHFNEQENVIFETEKAFQRDIAMLFFIGILLIMQQVKWLNWQSLVVTLVFAPAAVFNITRFNGSADLQMSGILEQIALWMELMLITDMVVTKRVRKLKQLNLGLFFFLIGVTVMMFVTRAPGFQTPTVFPAFFLLCLIPADRREWDNVLSGLLNAGILCFIQAVIVSQAVNPLDFSSGDVGRWYGYFLNIGTFGQFLGVQTALSVCSLVRIKNHFGRLNPLYFFSWLWLLSVVVVAVINGVSNYLVGLFFMAITLFVFGFGKKKFNPVATLIRGLAVVVLILLAGIGFLELVQYVSNGYDRAEFLNFVSRTPLKYFPAGAEVLAFKLQVAHEFRSILFHGMSITASFIKSPFLMLLNSLGAGRLFIWAKYLEDTSFMGNGGGVMVADYFALTAHNEYVQLLYEFGFFTGALYILFYIACFVRSIVNYTKDRNEIFLFSMTFLSMMFGMWTGEMSNIFFVLTFLSTFLAMAGIRYLPGRVKAVQTETETETETEDAERIISEKAAVKKTASVVAVVVLGLLAVSGCVVFGYKLFRDSHDAKTAAARYLKVADEEPVNFDTVVFVTDDAREEFSVEAVSAALGQAQNYIPEEEIEKVADRAGWTDSVFYTIKLPEEFGHGDRIYMELTARSTNGEEVPLEIMYYTSRRTCYLTGSAIRYGTVFTMESAEPRITIRFPMVKGSEPSVVMGNLVLKNYGREPEPEKEEETGAGTETGDEQVQEG
ncbi:MAG: hypothetical protein K5879_07505 [Lachnospiraceae bacterium]|nr:hypothetical protein [Lachnospiraceae bacterium]